MSRRWLWAFGAWCTTIPGRIWWFVRTLLLVLTTPFAEKDPAKQLYDDIPIVLSTTRIVLYCVLFVWAKMGLAAASKGAPGWPFWTAGCVIVVALPILNALSKLAEKDPAAVLDFAKVVYSRLGVGSGRGDVYPGDPETMRDREHEVVEVADGA